MKTQHILPSLALLATAALAGCEGEKDLIIIEGNLPIKTTTLYMVGDATPNGWSIDQPTPLTPSDDDPLVFAWEGNLYAGEMKLCLTTGSWDVGFIRPTVNGAEIGRTPIADASFQMHAGDPDEKWQVTTPGVYALRFDLRNWLMASTYLREPDAPTIEPIATETLYMVGDATPNGWSIDQPTELTRTADYIFEYEGNLTAGEMKLCCSTGSFDVPFVRPATDGVEITREGGVAEPGFVYAANPDNKWRVVDAGRYHLTFDLEHWTVAAEYLGELVIVKDPIATEVLYMIGDATPGGWSLDAAAEFTRDADNGYIFTWQGQLVPGTFKACIEKSYDAKFLRPSAPDVEVNANGVAASDFIYVNSPDDQWRVTLAGYYKITFDLENWTIAAAYLGEEDPDPNPDPDPDTPTPLESTTLYMIGSATPNGWSMDNASEFTRDADNGYIFTWEGTLTEGTFKACLQPDGTFSCPFLRPSAPDVEVNANGVAASDFVYTTSPDDQWKVTLAGRYRLTFDLQRWTIAAAYLD